MGILDSIGGAIGSVISGPEAHLGAGRASIEIDGQRVPLSAEGIEQARRERYGDGHDGDVAREV